MFSIIHTAAGLKAMSEAASDGTAINLTEMAVGDGDGAPITPDEAQTGLVNEVFRAAITQIYKPDALNAPNKFVAELAIPATEGGFTMREIGVFTADGTLFAVGSLPETYKPTASEGAFADTIVRATFLTSNAEIVTIAMDPNVVIATRAWVLAQDYATEDWVTARGYAPPGLVAHFARSTPPPGWLKCNGAAVSRTAYAALYAALGTTFGAGNGSTTFKLPDLRGEFLRGWDQGRGVDGGRGFGTAQSHAVERHNHYLPTSSGGTQSGTAGFQDVDESTWEFDTPINPYPAEGYVITTYDIGTNNNIWDGGQWAQETRPRNIAFLPCIKY